MRLHSFHHAFLTCRSGLLLARWRTMYTPTCLHISIQCFSLARARLTKVHAASLCRTPSCPEQNELKFLLLLCRSTNTMKEARQDITSTLHHLVFTTRKDRQKISYHHSPFHPLQYFTLTSYCTIVTP